METAEIKALVGLFVSFSIAFALSGWLIYSFYIKPNREERKKQS